MPTSFPHLQRRIGQDLWLPIGEDSASIATIYSGGITTSRVEWPPNVLDSDEADQQENFALFPPAHSQLHNTNAPEIMSFIYEEEAMPESIVPTVRRGRPVMNNNVTNLNDIRHDELDGHLSTIPHYPVFLEVPTRYSTGSRSRSPASIASSSTTAVFMSVGQLPGSEPFDSPSSSINMYHSDSSSISSPTIVPQPSSANSFCAEATVSGPLVTQPASATRHMATMSEISWFWNDLSQEYWEPPERGYYAPEPPEDRSNIRHTIHWSNGR